MKVNINIEKAIEGLLSQKYRDEFETIDGMYRHPQGINFYTWLFWQDLISKEECDRINAQIEKERICEEAAEQDGS